MRQTLRCLLCRESVPVEDGLVIYKYHLAIKHSIDYCIEWIVDKTLADHVISNDGDKIMADHANFSDLTISNDGDKITADNNANFSDLTISSDEDKPMADNANFSDIAISNDGDKINANIADLSDISPSNAGDKIIASRAISKETDKTLADVSNNNDKIGASSAIPNKTYKTKTDKGISNGNCHLHQEFDPVKEERVTKVKGMDREDWEDSLLRSMKDPAQIVKETEEIVIILDRFPKAKEHYMVLPREDIRDIYSLTPEHIPLLETMEAAGFELIKDNSREFMMGFHAAPHLNRLHLHVISKDLDSPRLYKKHHWNIFTTPYFISCQTVVQELVELGKVKKRSKEEVTRWREGQPQCHMCSHTDSLKGMKMHIRTHFPEQKLPLIALEDLGKHRQKIRNGARQFDRFQVDELENHLPSKEVHTSGSPAFFPIKKMKKGKKELTLVNAEDLSFPKLRKPSNAGRLETHNLDDGKENKPVKKIHASDVEALARKVQSYLM